MVSDLPDLTPPEVGRYARHLLLPDVGLEGQRRLKSARVLVVGAGGLGSPAALYLASAGVGTLGVADFDVVDESNLQRQVIHGSDAVGGSKVASAVGRLRNLNPLIDVRPIESRLTSRNALDVVRQYDVVVDGTDNFPTRYLLNDACVLKGVPYVYGAIFRFEGQVAVFGVKPGPCYRCLFRDPPPPGLIPSCEEAGVLGVLPGVIGSLQALEALKIVLGAGKTLAGRLVLFDALETEFRELRVRRDPECPVCGDAPTIRELIDYEAFCGVVAADAADHLEIGPRDLAREREGNARLLLLDVREPVEWQICRIEGSELVPLRELPAAIARLERGRDIVAICHLGTRSLTAARILRDAGFASARSLKGGVAAWADEVDPAMPRY